MPSSDVLTVEIGLFSGRRNPRMELAGETLDRFTASVGRAIGREAIHPPPPPRLGHYYGFFVRAPGDVAERRQLPSELDVYSGVVTERRGAVARHWRDVSGVEQFLIDQAFEQGHGQLLEKTGVRRSSAPESAP
jgi:hypothetical protein